MKVGPVYVARNSLGLIVGNNQLGLFGRQTLAGKPTGWALVASSTRLNRAWRMNIDRPTIGRYHW